MRNGDSIPDTDADGRQAEQAGHLVVLRDDERRRTLLTVAVTALAMLALGAVVWGVVQVVQEPDAAVAVVRDPGTERAEELWREEAAARAAKEPLLEPRLAPGAVVESFEPPREIPQIVRTPPDPPAPEPSTPESVEQREIPEIVRTPPEPPAAAGMTVDEADDVEAPPSRTAEEAKEVEVVEAPEATQRDGVDDDSDASVGVVVVEPGEQKPRRDPLYGIRAEYWTLPPDELTESREQERLLEPLDRPTQEARAYPPQTPVYEAPPTYQPSPPAGYVEPNTSGLVAPQGRSWKISSEAGVPVAGGWSGPESSNVQTELTGTWYVTDTVTSASSRDCMSTLVFEVYIRQEGTTITGSGVKRCVDGMELPQSQRTPIDFSGHIAGDTVTATIFESGARRSTNGTFRWNLQAPDYAGGSFTSDACNSSGTSVLTRTMPACR